MEKENGSRWRSKRARDAADDRLGELPDDLLLNIMERVDTLDAVKTCVLSKRMLRLPAMLSHLSISIGSIVSTSSRGSVLLRANRAVARVTDTILSSRNPEIAITRLRLRFVLNLHDARSIAESVARAMATQRIDAAEFEILTERAWESSTNGDLLCFGKQLDALVRACPNVFSGLTRLWLHNMRFGEPENPNIFGHCERLESLRLSHCDWGVGYVLQVEHARLLELQIDNGKFWRVELTCLPKLQRVTYVFDHWTIPMIEDPIYFGFVPQLSKLSLTRAAIRWDKSLELSQILDNVPSLEDLHLDFQSEKIWVIPECRNLLVPVLGKVRDVSLDNLPEGCDIAWTMFILEGAPSLKELCITVRDHWCIMETDKGSRWAHGYCEKEDVKWNSLASGFRHTNLVKLSIYGFQPDDNFMPYIRRVAEVAVKLAEISLHDRKVCGEDCGHLDPEIEVCPSTYPRTAHEKKQTTVELGLASPAMVHFRS